MQSLAFENMPFVSVIIPCYNHGKFLPEACKSVRDQNYPAIEIIVVDDGSVDNTKEIAQSIQNITYIYQHNQGLSAARNTGIKNSKGELLVFLDADDWLYLNAIITNVNYLEQNKELAFVSGDYDYTIKDDLIAFDGYKIINKNHYLHLLQGNYIGMIATVMFRKWAFNEFAYDTTLKNCEDYDLYLKITRKYPVLHHSEKIAVYRFHSDNMSGNIPAMLKGVLNVLEKQRNALKNESEKTALEKGKKIWKEYYCLELYKGLMLKKIKPDNKVFKTLLKYKPLLLMKYFIKKNFNV